MRLWTILFSVTVISLFTAKLFSNYGDKVGGLLEDRDLVAHASPKVVPTATFVEPVSEKVVPEPMSASQTDGVLFTDTGIPVRLISEDKLKDTDESITYQAIYNSLGYEVSSPGMVAVSLMPRRQVQTQNPYPETDSMIANETIPAPQSNQIDNAPISSVANHEVVQEAVDDGQFIGKRIIRADDMPVNPQAFPEVENPPAEVVASDINNNDAGESGSIVIARLEDEDKTADPVSDVAANAGYSTASPIVIETPDDSSSKESNWKDYLAVVAAPALVALANGGSSSKPSSSLPSIQFGQTTTTTTEEVTATDSTGATTTTTTTTTTTSDAASETDVTTLQDDVTTLTGSVDTLNTDVSTLQDQVGTVNSADLSSSVGSLEETAFRGIASSAALVTIVPKKPGKTVVNMGHGYFEGEHAIGVSVAKRLKKKNGYFYSGMAAGVSAPDQPLIQLGVGFEF